MEVNGVAAALQHRAFQVVVQDGSGRSAPILEGMDVGEKKILQALVEKELQPQGAAVGEGEDESGETTSCATDGDFPEAGPVGLSLLAGESTKTEKGFAAWGSQFGDDTAELADTAGVAAGADYLEEAGGAQAGGLVQGLAQKVEIGIGEAVAEVGMVAETIGVERGAHRLGVQAQCSGNRPDLPMLGMKQVADVSNLF